MFVVLEGPEGAGKTNCAERLVRELNQKAGQDISLYVREPGGGHIGGAVRGILLDPNNKGMASLTEFFLFQASRAQLLQEAVRPALAQGKIVVMDRYTLSTMAYQIVGRGLPMAPCLSALDLATGGLVPDITLLLTVGYEEGMRRVLARRKPDRLEQESEQFHRRVNEGYTAFASALPWNIKVVVTDQVSMHQVYHRVVHELVKFSPVRFSLLAEGSPLP